MNAVRPEVAALTKELHDLARRWLTPHIERIAAGHYQPRAKVINDAIWGTIHLHAWEVAILDSALMQRLRFLRQLGVAHWLYPSAGHSRLEHSLGVLHQMQALLSALDRSSSRAGEPLLDDVVVKLLRMAALLHDCGHTVMSHVSEDFIGELPAVSALRRHVRTRHGGRKPISVSEAFAAVLVESPAFQELLALTAVGADFLKNVPEACAKIAGFIVGGPVVPDRAFLTLLMSGATDADKLDYMPRDSRMAGVPTPVDVRRVIEKLRIVEVPIARLPEEYAAWAKVTTPSVKVLALTSSGARALDELAMGRTVLFEKIYHHHKVRAIEVMVRRALRDLPSRSVSQWLDMVDDDLMSASNLATFAPIRDRVLLKRALVLGAPQDESPEDEIPEAAWTQLTGPTAGAGDRLELDALRDEVIVEAKKIATIMGDRAALEALDAQSPEVDRTPAKKLSLDEWAYVGDSGEEIERANAVRTGQRSEAGKHAARQLIHFFAPEGAVLPVFLAARRLLRVRYDVKTGAASYRATRLDPDIIRVAEDKLVAANYLSDDDVTPADRGLRLISHREDNLETFLRVAWPRFSALAPSFGRYQAPNASRISPAAIAAFLRQFETEAMARAALRMLEAVEFVDRETLVGALRGHLERASNVTTVSPLGGPGDSSAFISYLMNDIPKMLRRHVRELELALDDDGNGEILLWDDFCGQGSHTITVLAQWLGQSDPAVLDEDLVAKMSPPRIERFKARQIKIAFSKARPSGLSLIKTFLERVGLTNVSVADGIETVDESNRLFDTAAVVPDSAVRSELRRFCEDVGRRLLSSKTTRQERPWTPADLQHRLLGYGNESHLIVFPYNVPTVTLTCLWEAGDRWQPLFPRRTKPAK